ncbi:PEGA domain-containing protein [Bacteroidota bacterium]
MKKFLVVVLFLSLNFNVFADEFVVIDFYHDPSDLSAQRDSRKDINGEQCAIIKVFTDISGMLFESNLGIEGDVGKKPGEYWLYVSQGEKRIKLSCFGFAPLEFNIPQKIESGNVYILKITNIDKGATSIDKDLVNIKFRINVEEVMISINDKTPVKAFGNIADLRLPPGQTYFKFIKAGYDDYIYELNVEKEKIIDIELAEGAESSKLKLPGIVIITSDPSGAEIFLNNQRTGITPYSGELVAGAYQMLLKKNMFQDYSGSFEIIEGETRQLPKIQLISTSAFMNISSQPENAEVFLGNKNLGKTPIRNFEIESGNYLLKAEKEMYYAEEKNIGLQKGETKNIEFNLKPAFGTLRITSQPTNADLYIDGQYRGKTPQSKLHLPSGVYQLKVSKDLWTEVTEKVEINDGEIKEKFIALNQNFGTLQIKTENADIYINDKKVGSNNITSDLKPGKYIIKAVKNRHHDAEKEVYVTVGSTNTYELNPQAQMGSISVFSEPFETQGAEIWIDGKSSGKTTPAVIELLIGNYEISIKKPDYKTESKNFIVQEGKSEKVTFQMVIEKKIEKPKVDYQIAKPKADNRDTKQKMDNKIAKTTVLATNRKIKKVKHWRNFWVYSTLLSAGTGAYFKISADNHYKDYQIADNYDDAVSLHDKVKTEDIIWQTAFGVGLVCIIPALINNSKLNKLNNNLSFFIYPNKNSTTAQLIYKF